MTTPVLPRVVGAMGKRLSAVFQGVHSDFGKIPRVLSRASGGK